MLVLLTTASPAWSLTLLCDTIEEELARIEVDSHPKGYEVFVHFPSFYDVYELMAVSVSHGALLDVHTYLWPGENETQFIVLYAAENTENLTVIANYSAGGCLADMKQVFPLPIQSYARR